MLSQHFHPHITTARFWINIFFNKLFFAFSNFVVQETLAPWPKPQQPNNAWRLKGPYGRRTKVPIFDQIFHTFFLLFQRNWFDVIFANFCFGQCTLKLQILQKYFAKPICQSYLTHIRCHDQTWVLSLNLEIHVQNK